MRVASLFAGILIVASGCREIAAIEPDLDCPYVLGVDPSGNAVPVNAEFRIRFSEPVKPTSVYWFDEESGEELPDAVVLGLADDEAYLTSAVDSPPLSETQRAKTIPADIDLSEDRDELVVRPRRPLEGMRTYVLFLSKRITDDRNNKLIEDPRERISRTVKVTFTTRSAADTSAPTATLTSPLAGSQGVPVSRGSFEVQFSEPLDESTLTENRIGLVDLSSQSEIFATNVSIAGTVATFEIPDHPAVECDRLCPDTEYRLFVSSSVKDLDGNGVEQGALAGQTFSTSVPRVVINELHIEPQTITGYAGKFLEILNAGNTDVDLSDWKLARCSTSDPGCAGTLTNQCPLKAGSTGSLVVPAGGYAVVAADSFNAAAFGVPGNAVMLKCGTTSTATIFANGFSSSAAYPFALLGPTGAIMSTYGGYMGSPNSAANKGKAFERKSALSPDTADNWTHSTESVSGAAGNFATPGRKNSVSP